MAVPLTEPAVQAPPWVLSARVTAPDLVRGYYDRPELLARIDPLEDRRITVLTAPGGFGKTTLLADLHRRARNRGRVAAWLTLTGDDTPAVLGVYLACAFERAGLPLSGGERPGAAAPAGYTALLAHAIEAWGAPCLLILDDAGRLVVRETVEALNALLRYGPRNLHVAVAGRRNPGLDVDEAVLAGRGLRVGVEQLRFSLSEIAGFVGPALSGSDLQALAARTEGWPVALQLYRNLQAGRTQPVGVRDFRGDKGVAANFLGERLLRTLSGADREFLLDLALFEWIEPALVDEVLETHDARRRVAALAELDGLLHDRGDDVVRLHPLIRDYCAARRFRDTPDRFRRIHAAIARSSARRNRLVPAVRHARDAGDDRLVGDVVEEAGGLRLWCTEGMTRLLAIDRLLTPAVIETHPRVAFLHCIVLAMRGKLGAARALCDDVGRRTRGFTRDRAGGDDRALRAERVLVQAMLFGFGCGPIGDEAVLGVIAELAALADDEDLDPAIRGAYNVVLSAGNHQRARFEAGRQRSAQAQAHFARCGSWYGVLCCHFHSGIADMAQGRVRSAAEHYASGRRIVRRHFPEDGGSTLILDVLTAELDLERNRLAAEASPEPAAARLRDMGVWFDVYAAAFDVAVAAACDRRGAAAALAVLDETHEHVRLPGLERLAVPVGVAGVAPGRGRARRAGRRGVAQRRAAGRRARAARPARADVAGDGGGRLRPRAAAGGARRGRRRPRPGRRDVRGRRRPRSGADADVGAGRGDGRRAPGRRRGPRGGTSGRVPGMVSHDGLPAPAGPGPRRQPRGAAAAAGDGRRGRPGRGRGGAAAPGRGRPGARRPGGAGAHPAGSRGAGGAGRRRARPGDRRPPRTDRERRPVPPEAHLPEDVRRRPGRRRAAGPGPGRHLVT